MTSESVERGEDDEAARAVESRDSRYAKIVRRKRNKASPKGDTDRSNRSLRTLFTLHCIKIIGRVKSQAMMKENLRWVVFKWWLARLLWKCLNSNNIRRELRVSFQIFFGLNYNRMKLNLQWYYCYWAATGTLPSSLSDWIELFHFAVTNLRLDSNLLTVNTIGWL